MKKAILVPAKFASSILSIGAGVYLMLQGHSLKDKSVGAIILTSGFISLDSLNKELNEKQIENTSN